MRDYAFMQRFRRLHTKMLAKAQAQGIFTDEDVFKDQRKRFVADALAAEKATLHSGKGYLAKDVHSYMKAKASGRKVSRPKAKSWR